MGDPTRHRDTPSDSGEQCVTLSGGLGVLSDPRQSQQPASGLLGFHAEVAQTCQLGCGSGINAHEADAFRVALGRKYDAGPERRARGRHKREESKITPRCVVRGLEKAPSPAKPEEATPAGIRRGVTSERG